MMNTYSTSKERSLIASPTVGYNTLMLILCNFGTDVLKLPEIGLAIPSEPWESESSNKLLGP